MKSLETSTASALPEARESACTSSPLKAAVREFHQTRPGGGVFQQLYRAVEADHLELLETGGEAGGVKAGAAADLQQNVAVWRIGIWPQRGNDLRGIVAEKPFAAECIEPGKTVEQTLRGQGQAGDWMMVLLIFRHLLCEKRFRQAGHQ